ncbi:MAG TPA: hypothetical protein VNG95_00195 [Gemmatimonadales bacterium]|nr:hypothetical protein [Gemmatimonadales bacterium]
MKVRDSGPTKRSPPADAPTATFEREGSWVVVRGRGIGRVAWLLQLLRDAAAATRAEPTRGLLIDLREFSAPLTDLDRYDVGMVGAEAGIAVPCAVILSTAMLDPRRLGETVARNRGVNARGFSSLEEGRAWLAQQAPPDA